jgi:putative ABC transport system permease protein
MKLLLRLAAKSLLNRKVSSLLAIVSMALSCALVLGVERLGRGLQDSFSNTISKTDLIVGARGGSIELLLYTVFHLGQASNNIRIETYNHFASHPAVAWTIPISLGDSFRGHRVIATDKNFFEHFRFRQDHQIVFEKGQAFHEPHHVVLGSDVAREQKLQLGQQIILSHGLGDSRVSSALDHIQYPFQIVGILKKTGTPIDRSLYISLEGMELVHSSTQAPSQITAFYLGAKSRVGVLHLQREIATYEDEPLSGIIPGVILSELWSQLSYIENVLTVISIVVLILAFVGILLSLFASLHERRRELALLRVVGARPYHILSLLIFECVLLTALGSVLGIALAMLAQWGLAPWIQREFSVTLPFEALRAQEIKIWLSLVLASPWVGLLPAWRAYRQSLAYDLIQR